MSSDETPTIKPLPDGPYLVRHLESLSNRHGSLETVDSIALCRCGGSANKPFCDGTHRKNGFSSAKPDERTPDAIDDHRGEHVTIHDNRGLCAHAGRCTDRLAAVWRLRQEPWIDPDGAAADEIAETVKACPSGALSVTVDGQRLQDPEEERPPKVFVAPNGPYLVTGGIELEDAERKQGASAEHYTLCRCGRSKNKPFCDGSHWDGFEDEAN